MVHARLEHAEGDPPPHIGERQRHAPMIVVGLGGDMHRAGGGERKLEPLLGAGLAGAAGDRDHHRALDAGPRRAAEIADAKAEIFESLERGGAAILNRDNPYYDRLRRHALEHEARVIGFGAAKGAEARLLEVDLRADGSDVKADILGETISYRLGAPGLHLVQNSLAVLAAVKLARANLASAARALSRWSAQTGRGERVVIDTGAGRLALIDETYNANPASMRAALATLALTPREEYPRRVAVLGDMLELGGQGPKLHLELAEFIDAAGVDVVFACGELMVGLYDSLPPSRQGGYAKTAEQLAPLLAKGVGAGDVVMIKGSFGSRMAPLVEALQRHFDTAGAQA